ncbi:hypothetical protein GOP47_0028956 [Adiantum capillus-veneris]|nr:hypothetical protein GOP47_0028956 [Adiantum capillus-veneris]
MQVSGFAPFCSCINASAITHVAEDSFPFAGDRQLALGATTNDATCTLSSSRFDPSLSILLSDSALSLLAALAAPSMLAVVHCASYLDSLVIAASYGLSQGLLPTEYYS